MMSMNTTIVGWLILAIFTTVSMESYSYGNDHISSQCIHTTYPTLCIKTLSGTRIHTHGDMVSELVNKTLSETNLHQNAYNLEILNSHFTTSTQSDLQARTSIGYCNELMQMSIKRLKQSLNALKQSRRKNKHDHNDIQTWLSAALTFQQTCKESIDAHPLPNAFMAQISDKMDHLSQLVSNSLSLVNEIAGKPKSKRSRRRLLENTAKHAGAGAGGGRRRHFPGWIPASGRRLLGGTGTINADAVVAKDGSGNYKTVSEAIGAANGNRFVIYVKSGVYNEQIRTKKDGITLIGDGKYSSIISWHDSVGGGSDLQGSATFYISGDGFIARDIGFQNTAGPEGHQAVALIVASDHSALYRCSIAGYQDTLYALSLRQFYRECDIVGTIDFIFGNAAAVFQDCNLIVRHPGKHGSYDVILANGRSDPGQNTGFIVQGCKITADSGYSGTSYLGRPWKAYSRAVVMESAIDGVISSRGWIEWPGSSGSSLKTLYFAEYANSGPGAGTSGRVSWPGYHVISREEANKFTVANFISGNSWLPSTGVTFISGLK